MWFGFTGMFALGLAKLSSEAVAGSNSQATGAILFGVLGLLILGSAFFGGLWFWLSGIVSQVSFWYGVLAPIPIIILAIAYQSIRNR